MMKKIIIWALVFCVFSCSTEDANNCFQNAGTTIVKQVEVPEFNRVLVNRNVALIITSAPNFSVSIETGENLMNDVSVTVVNNQLQLTDNNICNFVRDYNPVKVYVSAPNINEIRSSTQFNIRSEGVLDFENLKLISENFNEPDAFTVGDFTLQVATQRIQVVSNNLSSFYLSGTTENASVGLYSGIGRFEGRNLVAQRIQVYHRGSNDMVVNPVQELTGNLYGTGNLIAVQRPNLVQVTRHYKGRLIFE
ncbi:head GIN domain-containing protein [Bizionia sediminis]|uniref:Head GIN domain-containing protein n=1 Tax=Bizionia sediminis TaxID=1737064 RepID=A0ABW5KWS7_9FLAO